MKYFYHWKKNQRSKLNPTSSSYPTSISFSCPTKSFFPFFSDYGGRRRSEDFSPTGDPEWAVTKANSLRIKKSAHHIKQPQPQQTTRPHHVIEAAPNNR